MRICISTLHAIQEHVHYQNAVVPPDKVDQAWSPQEWTYQLESSFGY